MGHAVAAISPTLEIANAIASGMGSWMSSFAGFYLPRPDIPSGYLWLYWLNPLRYAYEAMPTPPAALPFHFHFVSLPKKCCMFSGGFESGLLFSPRGHNSPGRAQQQACFFPS